MCGFDLISDIAVDSAVFIASHDVVWVDVPGGLWGPHLPVPVIVRSMPDVSTVDNDKIITKDNRLKELKGGGDTDNPDFGVEDFSGETFTNAFDKMQLAFDDVAPGHAESWAEISNNITQAIQTFDTELGKLDLAGGWKGSTHDAALANVRSSFPEPRTAASGARMMGILVDAFQKTISAVKENIVKNEPNYESDLAKYPEHHDLINEHYNSFTRKVMQEIYAPAIQQIANSDAVFTAGGAPPVGNNELPLTVSNPLGGGGGPGSVGGAGSGVFGGGTPPSFSEPDLPAFKGPTLPETTLPETALPEATLPDRPEGLGDPTEAASMPAESLSDAAQQGASGAPSPTSAGTPGTGSRPPEGALGLGPRGAGGAPPKHGGGSGRGVGSGGGGGGAGRGPLAGRPASSTVAAGEKASPATTAARAGLGSGMGAPGMVPPAAGQRGGDPNAKGYQVMKALRRKKTGEQVMGKADAIVPVVGEPDKPQAARPEPEATPPDNIA
jgi:hypothetical protein